MFVWQSLRAAIKSKNHGACVNYIHWPGTEENEEGNGDRCDLFPPQTTKDACLRLVHLDATNIKSDSDSAPNGEGAGENTVNVAPMLLRQKRAQPTSDTYALHRDALIRTRLLSEPVDQDTRRVRACVEDLPLASLASDAFELALNVIHVEIAIDHVVQSATVGFTS